MRFEVTRTSGRCGAGEAPCKEAVPAHFPSWSVRTLPSPDAFDAKFGEFEGAWLSKGTDHRLTAQGQIARRFGNRPGWALDLDSLEALVAFCREHGEVVVQPKRCELGEVPEIEIYDDYRE